MSLSIGTVRTSVATIIGTVLATSAQPVNAYAYPLDSPELDALLVWPRAGEGGYIDYHRTMHNAATGALCAIALRIELRTGGGTVDAAKKMDIFLSTGAATSVFDALMADVTLAAVVQTLKVGGVTAPAWFQANPDGGREWLSASFDIDILARRPA